MTVFVVLAAVAVVVVVAGTLTARARRHTVEAANQVVPGVATRAPASWAKATTPEATLHRRLQEAVAALREAALAGAGYGDARAALAVQAVAIDDALVAAAAIPGRGRDRPLADVEAAVHAVEAAVAALAARPADDERADLDRALAEVTARVEALSGEPPT